MFDDQIIVRSCSDVKNVSIDRELLATLGPVDPDQHRSGLIEEDIVSD